MPSSWWTEIPRVLWLAFPVVFAGILHVVVIRRGLLAPLARPLDFGLHLRGRRVFGANKTLRGAVVMTAGACLGACVQGWIDTPTLEYFDYDAPGRVLVGALLGAGFVLGELPNSFLKRQCGVEPGQRGNLLFIVLDQVDSILGCLLLISLVWVPPAFVWALSVSTGVLLHIAVNGIFVAAGLKRHVF